MADDVDRRLNAFRPDLADARLEGRVRASRFVAGVAMRVCDAVAPMHRDPRPDSMRESEALFGDDVLVFEREEGWAWCQNLRDDYVGYVPDTAVVPVGPNIEPASHWVAAAGGALIFAGPDIKSQLLMRLPLNARVTVAEIDAAGFARLAGPIAGWLREQHIAASSEDRNPDLVRMAEALMNTPYLWGGCTRDGIDCSGLVQMSLLAAGRSVPRDSDMQEAAIGDALAMSEEERRGLATSQGVAAARLRRGDLVFWPGHVGLMADDTKLVHANAHHMRVVIEPLADVARRSLAGSDTPVRTIRRP